MEGMARIGKIAMTENWFVWTTMGGVDLYLHCDGTWHKGTKSSDSEDYPGIYPSREAAEQAVAVAMRYMIVFKRGGFGEPGKVFMNADAAVFALGAFLMNFFGPDRQVLNPPEPSWAKVYYSCNTEMRGAPLAQWQSSQ